MIARFGLFAAGFVLVLATPAFADEVSVAVEYGHLDELKAAFDANKAGDLKLAEERFSNIIGAYEQQYRGAETYRCAEDAADAGKVAALAKRGRTGKHVTVLGPGWCQALFAKGFVLIDLNRSPEAGSFLARAVEMAPTRGHYVNEYAEWYKSRHEWQKSYDLFAHAWDITDHDKQGPDRKIAARALRGMAFNKVEMGDLDAAEKLNRQSLELEPENKGVLTELDYIASLRSQKSKN
jgi:tetratricopeptide (TPR) repeat protein